MADTLRIGAWTFWRDRHLLRREDVERHLEPKQADLLATLAEAPGSVLGKDRLLEAVWGDAFVGEEVLTNAIYQLRRAFGDSARESLYIETIPRRGYRLVAPVSTAELPAAPHAAAALAGEMPSLATPGAATAGATHAGASPSGHPPPRWPAMLAVPARRWGWAATVAAAGALGIAAGATRWSAAPASEAAALVAQGMATLANGSAADGAEALQTLDAAVLADPGSAAAWEALAAARWSLVARGEISRPVGLPLVEQAARRAIALEPARPGAWTTLGQVHTARWEWAAAEHALRRGIELAPAAAHGHAAHAEYLLLTGRHEEARRAIATAQALAPDSTRVLLTAGFVHTMLRDLEAARDAYRRVLATDPQHVEATRLLEKLALPQGPPRGLELTAADVDAILRKGPLRPAIVAGLFAEAGEDERALEWLRRAHAEKDPSLLLVRLDERWTRLHGDPRYRSILADVGL